MKILIIITVELGINGIVDCIYQYLKAMDFAGLQIDILSTVKTDAVAEKKFKEVGCCVKKLEIRSKKPIRYVSLLAKLVRAEKYDIVHAHGNSATLAFDMLGAMLGGCKVRIAHSHNTTCTHLKTDKLLRPLFNFSYTYGFACGKEAGKWLFPGKKYTVISNGRDLNAFVFSCEDRQNVRKQFGWARNNLVVGHVGCFNKQKNHKFLLEVFAELKKIRPDARLFLMGDGELFEETHRQAEKLGIAEDVIFAGWVKNVSELLNGMDVMCLPSLYEGLPLVVLEWQANGLPCVISANVTDECSVTDLVSKIELSEKPAVWANTIARLQLPDRAAKRAQVQAAMRENGYDVVEKAKELKKLYLKLVAEKRERHSKNDV